MSPVTTNGPVRVNALIVNDALPVFDRVTVCAADVVATRCAANVSEDVDRASFGATPLPDTATVVGEASLVIVITSFAKPVDVGENVALNVRVAPGAIVTGSVSPETVKGAEVAIPLTVSGAVPLDVIVTVVGALVVPTR